MQETSTRTSTDDKYRAPALEKGLDIVELLAEYASDLTQAKIAKSLGRSPNEIYRMLHALVRRGFISKTVSGDLYQLSMKLFTLAHRHPPIRRFLDHAMPLLREATKRAHQSCHVGMNHSGEIVITAMVEAPGNWGLALRIGSVIGLNNTGVGQILAAFRSADSREEIIRDHILVDSEPRILIADLLAQLDEIKVRGYECMPSCPTRSH